MSTGDATPAMSNSKHDRMFGLDVCRTIAILSVVIGHMLLHSSPNQYLAAIGFTAIFGVDLFFCLSGFLIGRILLLESANWPIQKERGIMLFWYRRWMRTLPLYFFFFFVELRMYWGGASSVFAQKEYLIFAQNLAWSMPNFFSLTWSLAVEEWFYFLFPLLILFWIGIGKTPRAAVLITIASFLLIPAVLRFLCFDTAGGFNNLDPNIRHIVIFRLDSIGFGVLVAYIAHWHQALFQAIAKLRWLFIGMALVCMAFIKFEYFGLAESKLMVTLYFSIVALVFAGLIPFFGGLSPTRFSSLNRFIKYTSLVSYSMYLGHVVAFTLGMHALRRLHLFDAVYPNPWLTYPFFLVLVYLVASLTYFAIEKPILAMRDRRNSASPELPGKVLASVD